MKFIVALAAVVSAFAVMGVESFTSDFTKPETAKFWTPDKSGGLNKTPKAAYDAAKKVYVLDNSDSKATALMQNQKQILDVKKGDVVVVEIEACGNGQIYAAYEALNGSKWLGMGPSSKVVQLKKDWSKIKIEMTVKDFKQPTTRIMIDFGVRDSTNVMVKSITVSKAKK